LLPVSNRKTDPKRKIEMIAKKNDVIASPQVFILGAAIFACRKLPGRNNFSLVPRNEGFFNCKLAHGF
jgi:hypothetical protein